MRILKLWSFALLAFVSTTLRKQWKNWHLLSVIRQQQPIRPLQDWNYGWKSQLLITKGNALKATVNYQVGKLVGNGIEIPYWTFLERKMIGRGLLIVLVIWIIKKLARKRKQRLGVGT